MKRRTMTFLTSSLIALAFVAGYVTDAGLGSSRAAAAADSAAAPAAASSSMDAAIQSAYRTASPSVVFIRNLGTGTGSGIIYDASGDIVTNAHVVDGGRSFTVTFKNGRTARATLVGTDASDDLAVIHVNVSGLTPASFARTGSYHVAQTVLAIGSPIGLQGSVTSGLISGLGRTEQEPSGAYIANAIQTSAPINPGNSGGALVDLGGSVVGMPTIVQTSTGGNEAVQNVGFAIPSPRIVFVARQLIGHGRVTHTGRAFLGLSLGDSAAQSFSYGYPGSSTPATSGAYVAAVESGGAAASAGIRHGDVITRFDHVAVTSSDDLIAALAQDRPGDTVNVTVNRNGSQRSLRVTLGEMPASQ